MEFNGHGVVHGETPMGTFLGIPIHEGFPLKKAQNISKTPFRECMVL
jgi:hypothetical protein